MARKDFTFRGMVDYTRPNGRKTKLATWTGHCSSPGCGKEFVITSPAWLLQVSMEDADLASGAFSRRYCDEHKLTPEERLARLHEANRRRAEERKKVLAEAGRKASSITREREWAARKRKT